MSKYIGKDPKYYKLWCEFFERGLTSPELNEAFEQLNLEGRKKLRDFYAFYFTSMQLNAMDVESLTERLSNKSNTEVRGHLFHMTGLRYRDIQDLGLMMFKTQGGEGDKFTSIINMKSAVLAAAFLDAPDCLMFDGGAIPAPRHQLPWYYHADVIKDIKRELAPESYYTCHFKHGSLLWDSIEHPIGVTSLWLADGFTQLTFTVHENANETDRWEYRLKKLGAELKLVGPSVFISSRMLLHQSNHRVYRMIWPSRSKRILNDFVLSRTERILLYCRIFTPFVSEVSFFRGIKKEQPLTIKYPQFRYAEVVNALCSIGMIAKRDEAV